MHSLFAFFPTHKLNSLISPCKSNLKQNLHFSLPNHMNTEPKHMENTTHHHHRSPYQPPEEPNKIHQPEVDVVHVETVSSGMKISENESLEGFRGAFQVENLKEEESGSSSVARRSSSGVEAGDEVKEEEAIRVVESEENGREKLKKHRIEMAGRVWIPEIWGQEELLKDWIDCSAFDESLVPRGIMSARAALVQEGRRANSGGFRIENRC